MKIHSPSAPPPSSAHADPRRPDLRLLVLGLLCGLTAFAALPWMTRQWSQASDQAERLCARVQPPFVPLPTEAPARQLAGLNAR